MYNFELTTVAPDRAFEILVNISRDEGLLPNGKKPSPELMLIYHQ